MKSGIDDIGKVFPPRDVWDIAAYDTDDVVAGHRTHRKDQQPPDDSFTPGYRWGWANARKTLTGEVDGFEELRATFAHMDRLKN